MSCKHRVVYDRIRPDIGSFPSSWTCEDCNTTIAITWVPYLIIPESEKCDEPKPECDCICHGGVRNGIDAIIMSCSHCKDYYTKEEVITLICAHRSKDEKAFRTELLDIIEAELVERPTYSDMERYVKEKPEHKMTSSNFGLFSFLNLRKKFL